MPTGSVMHVEVSLHTYLPLAEVERIGPACRQAELRSRAPLGPARCYVTEDSCVGLETDSTEGACATRSACSQAGYVQKQQWSTGVGIDVMERLDEKTRVARRGAEAGIREAC